MKMGCKGKSSTTVHRTTSRTGTAAHRTAYRMGTAAHQAPRCAGPFHEASPTTRNNIGVVGAASRRVLLCNGLRATPAFQCYGRRKEQASLDIQESQIPVLLGTKVAKSDSI
ncbi:hypothetical protein HAX54_004128 [Datura stramonium]|uniref:Uncharacterized protein n=1 Tax=Datura stramonium TaxID=4076 RepID=A0ABS8T6H6_DATST|nr:hypothetical protein [Datura stramonium]